MNYQEMWNRIKEFTEAAAKERYEYNVYMAVAYMETLKEIQKIESEQYCKSLTETGY